MHGMKHTFGGGKRSRSILDLEIKILSEPAIFIRSIAALASSINVYSKLVIHNVCECFQLLLNFLCCLPVFEKLLERTVKFWLLLKALQRIYVFLAFKRAGAILSGKYVEFISVLQ